MEFWVQMEIRVLRRKLSFAPCVICLRADSIERHGAQEQWKAEAQACAKDYWDLLLIGKKVVVLGQDSRRHGIILILTWRLGKQVVDNIIRKKLLHVAFPIYEVF